MSTNLATMTPRSTSLAENHDRAIMNALRDSFYPGAREDSILMVLNYCKAAGLDPMTRPVHIVPMNVKKPGSRDYEWRDVVMPGIEFYRTKADRTGRYAGQDDAEFGPEIHNEAWGISYPQWCKVTVYKITEVGRVAYSAKVFWLEAYANKGKDSQAPNAMWSKRPYGQIEKCAEAAALRKAFPEVGGQPTADEMSGKTLDALGTDGADVTPVARITANRTDTLKAQLAARKAASEPVAPAPDLPLVLTLIHDASSAEELHGAVEMAKRLASDADKAEARKQFKARQAEMKKAADADPVPDLTLAPTDEASAAMDSVRRALASSKTQEDIDECLDFVRSLPLTDAHKQELNKLVDEAMRRIG